MDAPFFLFEDRDQITVLGCNYFKTAAVRCRNKKRLTLYDNLVDATNINHVKEFRVTDFFFGLRLLLEKIGENNYYQCDNNKLNQISKVFKSGLFMARSGLRNK